MHLVIAMIALLSLFTSNALALTCGVGEKTEFGVGFNPVLKVKPNTGGTLVDHGQSFTVQSVRLQLSLRAPDKAIDGFVVIRDKYFRVLATITPGDFKGDTGGYGISRWTGRLPALHEIYLELATNEPGDIYLEVNRGIATPSASAETRLFSVIGAQPAWVPLSEIHEVGPRRAGYAVGMLLTGQTAAPGAQASPTWCCSGAMITSSLFLTNWHCGGSGGIEAEYWTQAVCNQAIIDLGWNAAVGAGQQDGAIGLSQQVGCQRVVAKDRRLDYAILRVGAIIGPGGISGTPIPATINASPVSEGDIYVVHHAQCQPKLVSKNCRVQNAALPAWTGTDATALNATPNFSHNCDTEPGSSGGPVFNTSRELIGIHHAGFDRDADCKPIDPRVNKAIGMNAIMQHLEKQYPSVRREINAPGFN